MMEGKHMFINYYLHELSWHTSVSEKEIMIFCASLYNSVGKTTIWVLVAIKLTLLTSIISKIKIVSQYHIVQTHCCLLSGWQVHINILCLLDCVEKVSKWHYTVLGILTAKEMKVVKTRISWSAGITFIV